MVLGAPAARGALAGGEAVAVVGGVFASTGRSMGASQLMHAYVHTVGTPELLQRRGISPSGHPISKLCGVA